MRVSKSLAGFIVFIGFLCLRAVPQVSGNAAQGSQEVHHDDMLRAYLQRIAFQQLAQRKDRIAEIRTRTQFEKRKAEVRRQLLAMMGGLPNERSPLKVRRMGTIDRGDYRVEKLIYESLPRFYVTANLYVPKTGSSRFPAILQPTGHSLSAKAGAFYQDISLGLVKSGFVVLTYDPVGQGERGIFYDSALGGPRIGRNTTEHEMVGIQSLLAGESIARYMVWDGMRGIDLLQSLPYVDSKRIGVTGCSGGGTLTSYIAALDDRVQVAAPACYITDWEDQLLGTGPQDAEQQFPDQLKNGLNHPDLVEAFAPKPYLINSTTDDFFPIAGSRKALAESRRIYALFGAEDKVSSFVAPGGHGVPKSQREAIEAWMTRWLKDGTGTITPEPLFQTEYEEDLLCTKTGQISTTLGGDTSSTLNIRRFSKLTPPRPALTGRQDVDRLKARMKNEVLRLTRYEESKGPLHVKTMGSTEQNGHRITRLSYEPEPGRVVPALLVEPTAALSRKKTVLYIDGHGMDAAAAPHGGVDQLAQLGDLVVGLDPSGIGETTSTWTSYSSPWFGSDERVTWLALMVGKPLVGIRMDDILRGVDLLKQKGLLYDGKCLGFARGAVAVDMLHAAVMDQRIAGVAMEDSLISYGQIARSPIHRQIFEAVVPGVLGKYDLPDLVAALAPRPVWLVNLRSPVGNPVFLRDARHEYEYAASAYAAVGASKQFRLRLRREGENVASAYSALP